MTQYSLQVFGCAALIVACMGCGVGTPSMDPPPTKKSPAIFGPLPPPPERAAWYCFDNTLVQDDSCCEPTRAQCEWRRDHEARLRASTQGSFRAGPCEEAFGRIWCVRNVQGSCSHTKTSCEARVAKNVEEGTLVECEWLEAKPPKGYVH